jgi:hypothetical protein
MPISQKKNRMKGLIRERGASWELRVCLGRDPLAGSNPTIRAPSWQQRVRTDHHIQHIYTKIAMSNRAAATRWAVDHGVSGAATA